MGGHGFTEVAFAEDEPLVRGTAEDPGEPFAMDEAESEAGDQKRHGLEKCEWHGRKVRFVEVAVNKGPVEHFLEWRDDESAAEDATDNDQPCDGAALSKLNERVPWFAGVHEFGIERIESYPKEKNKHSDQDAFPADFPAHFGDDRPDGPEEPDADESFCEINPVFGSIPELALERS